MALILCYECEKEISDKAPACPHCGASGEKDGVYKTYDEIGGSCTIWLSNSTTSAGQYW